MTSSPVLTSTPTQTVQAFLDAFARHDVAAAIAAADPRVAVTVHPLGVHATGTEVLNDVLTDLVRARAYSNRCPHQASALDEGDLDGDTLTCAKHLWEFNATTGCGINPDDVQLTSFGCRVGDDGTIYVDIGR